MPNQTLHGSAFEYAICSMIKRSINGWLANNGMRESDIRIIRDDRYSAVESSFNEIEDDYKEKMIKAAEAGLKHIAPLEPHLWHGTEENPIEVQVNINAGGSGDVRDILMFNIRNSDGSPWEIGLSCKWNHKALKSPRIAKDIDFGREWLNHPCSQAYWEEIHPIMNELEAVEGSRWSDFPNKSIRVYRPLLNAFQKELLRLSNTYNDVPRNLVEYMVGRFDFYKIIGLKDRRRTDIQAFNLHSTLNRKDSLSRPRNTIESQNGGMPTRIISIDQYRRTNTTINIILDEGWQFRLRLHSADTFVKTSVKFDINFEGSPFAFFTESWI